MSRQRFLLDLVCIGGALALAAGLASSPPPPPPPAVSVADGHHPQWVSVPERIGRP